MADYTALYLAGAVIAFVWVIWAAAELITGWIERSERELRQWDDWIAAYQARHGRK